MSTVRQGAEIECISDKLVSQGRFLQITDNIKTRHQEVSDMFLQVCVWAVTPFPNWQFHKHNNIWLYCSYRL